MSVVQGSAEIPLRAGAKPSNVPHQIIVGRSAEQEWIVKDNWGCLGGIFRTLDAALRFARREAGVLRCGLLVVDRDSVELDFPAR